MNFEWLTFMVMARRKSQPGKIQRIIISQIKQKGTNDVILMAIMLPFVETQRK